jgi:hypothetical protein
LQELLVSQELDAILNGIGRAASRCYDLNDNGNLTVEEQTLFYQFAENIVIELIDIHAEYDEIAAALAQNPADKAEMDKVWAEANDALDDVGKSITSPKLREAAAKTASAIDRTSTVLG